MRTERTIKCCFVGYIVQAIVNNYIPLLFLTFQRSFDIPVGKITVLITVNFVVQLCVDAVSVLFVDRIGYRASVVIAHLFAALGLVLLPLLPSVMDPFAGILIAVVLYAVGGGLLEVLVSPIMEVCPTKNKEKAMSLLHSFYCWGQVGVVLLSTLFFAAFGTNNWRILSVIWAIIPIANGIAFLGAPIGKLVAEGEKGFSLSELFRSKLFWVLALMMICAGASELAVSQWASFFAEKGLSVSKSVGDLAGPMAFAVLMGAARAFYGKFGEHFDTERFMGSCAALCAASYFMISLIPNAVVNLIGCGICGLSVGIMWPGTFSKAAASLRGGGTALFSMLALAGDVGCSGGPALVGFVTGIADGDMKKGILSAVIFPVLMLICCVCFVKRNKQNSGNNV